MFPKNRNTEQLQRGSNKKRRREHQHSTSSEHHQNIIRTSRTASPNTIHKPSSPITTHHPEIMIEGPTRPALYCQSRWCRGSLWNQRWCRVNPQLTYKNTSMDRRWPHLDIFPWMFSPRFCGNPREACEVVIVGLAVWSCTEKSWNLPHGLINSPGNVALKLLFTNVQKAVHRLRRMAISSSPEELCSGVKSWFQCCFPKLEMFQVLRNPKHCPRICSEWRCSLMPNLKADASSQMTRDEITAWMSCHDESIPPHVASLWQKAWAMTQFLVDAKPRKASHVAFSMSHDFSHIQKMLVDDIFPGMFSWKNGKIMISKWWMWDALIPLVGLGPEMEEPGATNLSPGATRHVSSNFKHQSLCCFMLKNTGQDSGWHAPPPSLEPCPWRIQQTPANEPTFTHCESA